MTAMLACRRNGRLWSRGNAPAYAHRALSGCKITGNRSQISPSGHSGVDTPISVACFLDYIFAGFLLRTFGRGFRANLL